MEQQIINIIQILVGMGITALTPFAVRTLISIRSKAIQELGVNTENTIETYATKVITAIAQKYGTLENEQKFAKAISLLEAKFGVNFLTENELEVLIENSVAQLKIAEGQVISKVNTPVAEVKPLENESLLPTNEQKSVTDTNTPVEKVIVSDIITTPIADISVVPIAVIPATIVTDEIANAITSLVTAKVTEAVNQTTIDTKAQTIANIVSAITNQA